MNTRLLRVPLAVLLIWFIAGCGDTTPATAPEVPGHTTQTLSIDVPDGLLPTATLSYTYMWEGHGVDSDRCDKVGEGEPGQRPPEGWMHWLFNTKGESGQARLVLSRDGEELGSFEPQAPLTAGNWHFFTPFFEIGDPRTLEAEVHLDEPGAYPLKLILSDYCAGIEKEKLVVTKTAETSFTREHFWDITKIVETDGGYFVNGTPKIWLYTDGSGDETATWTVDVTYEGYEDSDWLVQGEITVENTGTLEAVINSVDDVLAGTEITVDCGVDFPHALPPGETLTCTYDEAGYIEGKNVVTVTTERATYGPAKAYIVWGDPSQEINATVNVKDVSDLFGEEDLGSVTAPHGDSFTYDKVFTWEAYGADGCGSFQYGNVATIVETEQSAQATLKVNVQCFIDETAYAKGDATEYPLMPADGVEAFCDNGFNQWGWTNQIAEGEYNWNLWAGAGQCDTSRGELVGTVAVTYGADGSVSAVITLDEGYVLLEEHVYAGSTMFPQQRQGRRFVDTVAPGQYYIEGDLSGNIWVIIHGVVGLPDPDFGPDM